MERGVGRIAIVSFLALMPVLGSGCLVDISRSPENPDRIFEETLDEMRRVQRDSKDQKPGDVHLMVYEKDSRNLIRIRVPMWLLEKFSDKKSILDASGEFRNRRWADASRVHVSLEDLKRMGPGVILQVNDRDSRVLLWLR